MGTSLFSVSDLLPDRHVAQYIDETGPGWFPGLPAHLIGDRVAFYSRLTLQQIGAENVLVDATGGFGGSDATMEFRDPIPEGVYRYDMLISLDRASTVPTPGQSISAIHIRQFIPLFWGQLTHSTIIPRSR